MYGSVSHVHSILLCPPPFDAHSAHTVYTYKSNSPHPLVEMLNRVTFVCSIVQISLPGCLLLVDIKCAVHAHGHVSDRVIWKHGILPITMRIDIFI